MFVTGQHGADQQGQGNTQVLVNILDLGANVQAACDMARFSHNQVSNKLQLESQLFKLVGPQLAAMGHDVSSTNGSPAATKCTLPIGGFYRAGSNFREDGQAAGF